MLLIANACGTTPTDDAKTGGARRVGGDAAGAGEDGGGSRVGPADPNEIVHVLSTGQSNSIGFAGVPVLTTQQPFDNVMFDTGVMTATACDDKGCRGYAKPTRLVPLVEGDSYFSYPAETMSSALANAIAKQTGATLLASVHGRSGNTYECLRKGGCDFLLGEGYTSAFGEAIEQVADGSALAASSGKTYRVGAVTAVHGESEHYANPSPYPLPPSGGAGAPLASYADALLEWQRDYDASIRATTRQTQTVPLFISQMSNWNDRRSSDIPLAQLDAHARSGGKVVLVAPTYMLPFADDCIHFTSHGLRMLGEYFAKAYVHVVAKGRPWEPVRPTESRAAAATIRVRFAVPKPPLVFDTATVIDPGNYGFEVVDESGDPIAITSVALSGTDTVVIALATAASTSMRVRYAMNATPQTCPGPQTGARGNLRDSDDGVSSYGYVLPNWAVHFDVPVR